MASTHAIGVQEVDKDSVNKKENQKDKSQGN